MNSLTRRRRPFILAALLLGAALGSVFGLPAVAMAEPGEDFPVDNVVVIMQEDRTFDHYFGTYPGANGWPKEYALPSDPLDPASPLIAPHKLDSTRTPSLPHSEKAMRAAFNDGRNDSFVRAAEEYGARDGSLALGYYDYNEIPIYWHLADEYVLADNWFSSVMGPSFPNHLYMFSGTSEAPDGTLYTSVPARGLEIDTIFDRLEEAGVSWKVYVQGYDPKVNFRSLLARLGLTDQASQLVWVPLVGIPRFVDDPVLSSKIVPLDQYFIDAANGELPQVSYITPSGLSEHPPGDLTLGHYFVGDALEALMMSPQWETSAFVVTWDEWGGWADHVPPPQVDDAGFGMRVPALIVSPYAKRGYVDHTLYDHTSVLAFIETLYGVEPLASRDAGANDLMNAFDFNQPPRPPKIIVDKYPAEAPLSERPATEAVGTAYERVFAVLLLSIPTVVIFESLRRTE